MIKIPGVELYINAPMTGVIMMDTDCAVGKTYAATMLKSYQQKKPNDVLVLTYMSGAPKEDYIKKIKEFNGTFLFLDRYDRYMCEEINELLVSKKCYRFVDSKNPRFWCHVPGILCETILERDKITISKI